MYEFHFQEFFFFNIFFIFQSLAIHFPTRRFELLFKCWNKAKVVHKSLHCWVCCCCYKYSFIWFSFSFYVFFCFLQHTFNIIQIMNNCIDAVVTLQKDLLLQFFFNRKLYRKLEKKLTQTLVGWFISSFMKIFVCN